MIETSEGIDALIYSLVSYHCPQWRSILARLSRDGRLRKLIPLSPGWTSDLRLQYGVLAPWTTKLASSIHHGAVWGKQDIDVEHNVWTWIFWRKSSYRIDSGEPRFEHDFPPGSDIVGDILCGPKPAERMEFELFNRLAAQVEICNSEL